MKKIMTLIVLISMLMQANAQNDTTKTETTEVKIGKTKILVVEEDGNKTTINIAPGTDVEKLLDNMFNFTDSLIDATIDALSVKDTVEVVNNNPEFEEKSFDAEKGDSYTDTVEIGIGENKLVIVESDNKTLIKLYNKKNKDGKAIINIQDDDKKVSNKADIDTGFDEGDDDDEDKEHSFEGDWPGLELGINTLYNGTDFTMPLQYSDMEINYGRSWFVNLNLFQYDIGLIKDHVGLVTGVGFQFRNYRFVKPNLVFASSDTLIPLLDTANRYVKSKLQTSHLRVPLYIEFKLPEKGNFHIMAGIIGDLVIGAHTKNVFYVGDSKNKVKSHDLQYLNFLNYSLSFRVGFESISIFVEYGMTPMFNKYKGPALYPVNFGASWNFFF